MFGRRIVMMLFYYIGLSLSLILFSASVHNPEVKWIGIANSGTISGYVTNVVNDLPIEGVEITVGHLNGAKKAVTKTDENGFFIVPGLPAQNYNVVADNHRFGRLTISSVPVAIGNEVVTHFILMPMEAYH